MVELAPLTVTDQLDSRLHALSPAAGEGHAGAGDFDDLGLNDGEQPGDLINENLEGQRCRTGSGRTRLPPGSGEPPERHDQSRGEEPADGKRGRHDENYIKKPALRRNL